MATTNHVNAAFEAWLASTDPASPHEPEDGLHYRQLGHAYAVLDNESTYLVLCRIETDANHRGEGHASRLIEHLKELCDRHEVTLLAQASAYTRHGLDQETLLDWYARHGFAIDRERSAEPLVWYPDRPT
jgi:GNAT superfamily N-acetyltransferase